MAKEPSFYLSWGGVISIPVKTAPAARRERMEFKNLHASCAAKGIACTFENTKKGTYCGKVVEGKNETVKGYFTSKESFVVVTEDELAALHVDGDKKMEVIASVPAGSVDPVYFEKSYYMVPANRPAEAAFSLLRAVLEKTKQAVIVQYEGSGRDKLGMVLVHADGLAMYEMFWQDEVREFHEKLPRWNPADLTAEHLELGTQLLAKYAQKSVVAAIEHRQDSYRQKATALVEARIAGKPAPVIAAAPAPAPVIDLTAALRKAVAAMPAREKTEASAKKPAAKAPAKAPARKRGAA